MAANEEPTIPPGVGMTALGAAYVRAAETLRPDHLFSDPLAAKFVEASGWSPPGEDEVTALGDGAGGYWESIQLWLVVRTRFLDEYVIDAARSGIKQIVLLGAGLDARAFRIDWREGTRLFELDTSDVLNFKERALESADAKPRCERFVVRTDLREDWPADLKTAGFDPEQPTAWIAEGLLIYLTPEENDGLLERVSALSPTASRLAITLRTDDGGGEAESTGASNDPLIEPHALRALWRSPAPEDPAAWLDGFGWDARVFDATERATVYKRPIRTGGRNLNAFLISATRR